MKVKSRHRCYRSSNMINTCNVDNGVDPNAREINMTVSLMKELLMLASVLFPNICCSKETHVEGVHYG